MQAKQPRSRSIVAKHLTALANAHTMFVGNVSVPDSIFGIDADAVRNAVTEVGPYASVDQASIRTISKAVSFRSYYGFATISVELSGIIAMPLRKARASAT
jgi:hypothetical protein